MKLLLGLMLQVGYFVILGAVFVPLSASWQSSWTIFAKEMIIRIAISVVFATATSRVLNQGIVGADRITPGPPQPPLRVEPVSAALQKGGEILPLKLRLRRRIIFWLCACLFFVNLASEWRNLYPLVLSPHGVIAFLWTPISSFCMAWLIGWLLSFVLLRQKRNDAHRATKKSKSIRWRLILLVAFIVVAVAYHLIRAAWWGQQPWTEEEVDATGRWTMEFVCLSILILFWMPKPGQMSINEPESYHVVPSARLPDDDALNVLDAGCSRSPASISHQPLGRLARRASVLRCAPCGEF